MRHVGGGLNVTNHPAGPDWLSRRIDLAVAAAWNMLWRIAVTMLTTTAFVISGSPQGDIRRFLVAA